MSEAVRLVGLEQERKVLTSAVKARKPALCIGETGVAKSSLAREVLESLCPAGVVRVNLNGGTTPDELEGRFQLKGQETYFQYGVLVMAMREGKGLILDEINAALPDTLFVIHAMLEDPPRLFIPETDETIQAHPDFCVIATMNPTHEYAGTRQLNMALYSRFAAVVRFQPLSGDKLAKAIMAHLPSAPTDTVTRVVDVVDQLAALRKEEKLTTPIGVREAIAAVAFATDGLTLKESLVAAIANKLDPSERATAKGIKLLTLDPKKAKWTTMAELVALAESAADAQAESAKLTKKMERYDGLVTALKAAGLQTVEEVEQRLGKGGK